MAILEVAKVSLQVFPPIALFADSFPQPEALGAQRRASKGAGIQIGYCRSGQ
jgi:hypothetical protein